MRTLFAIFALTFAVSAFATPSKTEKSRKSKARIQSLAPALVSLSPTKIYAPKGFDDNDNVQLIIDGELQDTCHKIGPTEVKIDRAGRTISVRPQAYFYPGAWCAQVNTPYVLTIDLGILPSGSYNIASEDSEGQTQFATSLPIQISKSANPDENLYAPVSDAVFQKSELLLTGTFHNSCMHLREAKVSIDEKEGIIEILPIADMERSGCAHQKNDFSLPVALGHELSGRYLVHVRSLNGQSVNRILSF